MRSLRTHLNGVSTLNTVLPGTGSNDARTTVLPGCGMAGKGRARPVRDSLLISKAEKDGSFCRCRRERTHITL